MNDSLLSGPTSIQIFETALPATILAACETYFFLNYGRKDAEKQIEGVIKEIGNLLRYEIRETKDEKTKYKIYMMMINLNDNLKELLNQDKKERDKMNKQTINFAYLIVLGLFITTIGSSIYIIKKHTMSAFKKVDILIQTIFIIIGVLIFQYFFYFNIGQNYNYVSDAEFQYKIMKYLHELYETIENKENSYDEYCSSNPFSKKE